MLSHQTAAEVQGLADKPITRTFTSPSPLAVGLCSEETIAGSSSTAPTAACRSFPAGRGSCRAPGSRTPSSTWFESAATFEQGYSWISRAVSRDLVTIAMLRVALAGRRRFRWRAWLADALEDSGGRRQLVAGATVRQGRRASARPAGGTASGAPGPSTAGHTTRTNWYARYRVAVEIDGPTYHQGRSRRGGPGPRQLEPCCGTRRRPSGSAPWASASGPARALPSSGLRCAATAGPGARNPCGRTGCAVAQPLRAGHHSGHAARERHSACKGTAPVRENGRPPFMP